MCRNLIIKSEEASVFPQPDTKEIRSILEGVKHLLFTIAIQPLLESCCWIIEHERIQMERQS